MISIVSAAGRSAALIVVLLALATVAAHADSDFERRTLAGLRSMHVQIELRGDDLAKFDVSDPTVRPEIESRLTAAGITLLDVPTSSKTPGVPWLFLFLTVVRSENAKEYAWAMQLELQQRACLERDPKVCESVTSWKTSRVGSVGRRQVKSLPQDVADLATLFVNAWTAANPGRGEAPSQSVPPARP